MQTCTSSTTEQPLIIVSIFEKTTKLLFNLIETIVDWNKSIWYSLADFVVDNYGYSPMTGRSNGRQVTWH